MPLIGYNYGAGNYALTREISRDTRIILAMYAAACLIILNHLVGLYGLVGSQPISNTCSLILGVALYRILLRKTAL